MGANTSREHHGSSSNAAHANLEELVDLGSVLPNGIYAKTPQDYDHRCVRSLIVARKLAPFYKGLADAPEPGTDIPEATASGPTTLPTVSEKKPMKGRSRSSSGSKQRSPHAERQKLDAERLRQRQQTLYKDAIECPICFLYYPANINRARCCNQPVCTECFVQIRRPPETPSVPASCPFCLVENFGVIYEPPAWSEQQEARSRDAVSRTKVSPTHSKSGALHTASGASSTSRPRRKSSSHTNTTVVLVDHVRPNWNKPPPLPSGSSSRRNSESGRPSRAFLRAAAASLTRPGRSASSVNANQYNEYLAAIRSMNADLEEAMVMEAIRLSLIEEQERQERLARNTSEGDANTDPATVNASEIRETLEAVHQSLITSNATDENESLANATCNSEQAGTSNHSPST